MRFLILAFDVDIGRQSGDAVHVKELAANLVAIGHDVRVVTGGGSDHRGVTAGSFHNVTRQRLWSVVRQVSDVARDSKSDLIYERRLSPKVGYITSRLLRIPYFVEVNGLPEAERSLLSGRSFTPSWLQVRTRRFLLRRARKVVAVSDTIRDVLSRSYGLEESHIRVVPNGVNTDLFRPQEQSLCRHQLGLEGNDPILGFAGSLTAWQGVDIMIRAVSELRNAGVAVRGLIVGGGPERRRLEELVESKGLQGRVVFTGPVPYQEVPRYIGAFDLALSIKPPMLPGSPLKVREYMACARPVIASQGTQYDFRIVEDAGAGILVDSSSARAVAEGITGLLNDDARRAVMGARGREYAVKNCSWRLTAQKVAAACGA